MRVFPHATLDEEPELSITSGHLMTGNGGGKIEVVADEERRLISVSQYPVERYPVLQLEAHASVSKTSAQSYRAEAGSDIQVVLSARCGTANLRQSMTLRQAKSSDTEWNGTIELDRRSMRDKTDLQALFTGTQHGRAARWLGASQAWRIFSDESVAPRASGLLMDVKWVDFKSHDAGEHLNDVMNEPFYVDLLQEKPTILLNSSVRGLRTLLPSEGKPPGVWRPIHEVLTASIVRSAWQAAFSVALDTALRSLEATEGADSENVEMPGGWQGLVLKNLLPKMYAADEEESLREAVREVQADGMTLVQSKALAAVSASFVQDGRTLRSAVDSVRTLGEELDAVEEEE